MQFLTAIGKAHALGHTGEVNEVADVILFVSSDAASFMTGAEILVDGGLTGKNAFSVFFMDVTYFDGGITGKNAF